MKTGVKSESRFETDASRYAAYLETPQGRLRADLAFANLLEFLPASAGVNSLRAFDLGCGTGSAAVRLARLGIHVTLLDSSATMLALTERTIVEAGVSDKVTAMTPPSWRTFCRRHRSISFSAITFWNISMTQAPSCVAPCV
ncbi:MAG TPA: methyltransferase domain-containing protein [Candidatus Acidoferrum sp.]